MMLFPVKRRNTITRANIRLVLKTDPGLDNCTDIANAILSFGLMFRDRARLRHLLRVWKLTGHTLSMIREKKHEDTPS